MPKCPRRVTFITKCTLPPRYACEPGFCYSEFQKSPLTYSIDRKTKVSIHQVKSDPIQKSPSRALLTEKTIASVSPLEGNTKKERDVTIYVNGQVFTSEDLNILYHPKLWWCIYYSMGAIIYQIFVRKLNKYLNAFTRVDENHFISVGNAQV